MARWFFIVGAAFAVASCGDEPGCDDTPVEVDGTGRCEVRCDRSGHSW